VSVHYQTDGTGSAIAGADYTPTSGTMSWLEGDASPRTFQVNATGGTPSTGDTTVGLALQSPTGGAVLGAASARLTITAIGNESLLVASAAVPTLQGEGGATDPLKNDQLCMPATLAAMLSCYAGTSFPALLDVCKALRLGPEDGSYYWTDFAALFNRARPGVTATASVYALRSSLYADLTTALRRGSPVGLAISNSSWGHAGLVIGAQLKHGEIDSLTLLDPSGLFAQLAHEGQIAPGRLVLSRTALDALIPNASIRLTGVGQLLVVDRTPTAMPRVSICLPHSPTNEPLIIWQRAGGTPVRCGWRQNSISPSYQGWYDDNAGKWLTGLAISGECRLQISPAISAASATTVAVEVTVSNASGPLHQPLRVATVAMSSLEVREMVRCDALDLSHLPAGVYSLEFAATDGNGSVFDRASVELCVLSNHNGPSAGGGVSIAPAMQTAGPGSDGGGCGAGQLAGLCLAGAAFGALSLRRRSRSAGK
jgi:hypothetical protein